MSRILKTLTLFIATSALVLLAAACATEPAAEPEMAEKEEMAAAAPVKIGVLLPFTGPLGEFGAAFQKAADLAEEHLAAGGYPVEIVYGDTETNPTAAVESARKLVEVDQVHAVVGAAASSSSLAVAESVTIPKGVPQISYASTSPLLTILPADEGQDFLFRTVPSDALQGVVLAGVAVAEGYTNVAILYVNNPYGQGLKDNFQAAFEAAGGTVSAAVPHDETEATTYVAELRKAIEGEPEVLLALSYPGHATIYLREAIENDFIKKFLFVDGTRSEQIIEAVGAENLEGMLGTAPGSAETPSLALFTADYQEKYGELPPLPFMTNVYDAVVIAALAALAAEVSGAEVTPAAVRDMLRTVANPDGDTAAAGAAGVKAAIEALRAGGSINYEGAAGAHDFDANGDVATPIEVWKYAGGTIETVRTEEVTIE